MTAKPWRGCSREATMNDRPTTITAEELNENADYWAKLKDAGECSFIWKGDHIDGIGEFNGGYVIEYGGLMEEVDFVNGDTIIAIKWLQI